MDLMDLLAHVKKVRRISQALDEARTEQLSAISPGSLSEHQRANLKRKRAKIAADEGLLTEFRDLERWIEEALKGPCAKWGDAAAEAEKKYLSLLERQMKGREET